MNRLEDAIRDYLAEHLGLLEPNLQLFQKEFRVPNPEGSGGRIDILAKDNFGQFVIIEIKRSDQSARQALNEIHKYTALFRLRQGLDEKKVRLIVVSTDWYELLLPLSEYAATTPYTVEGIRIEANPGGTVVSASKIDLKTALDHSGALDISRCHMIYLFESSSMRDKFSVEYRKIVSKIGVEDFVLFHCDYSRSSDAVIYPHAVYFCFCSPMTGRGPKAVEEMKAKIEWDDELDDPDENFACAIERARDIATDALEIGYPEKLVNMNSEWGITVATREGRFSSPPSLLTDLEIIRAAKAIEGGSPYYLSKIVSPRFKAAWDALRSDLLMVLRGYPKWEFAIPQLLNEVASINTNAVVSVSVYAPANLLMSLYSIADCQDYSKCPQLEIVVEYPNPQSVTVFLGFLAWNGVKISQSYGEVLGSIFDDVFHWRTATHFGSTFEFEANALAQHNLDALVVEWRASGGIEFGPSEITEEDGGLKRLPPENWNHKSIKEFTDIHRAYLQTLKRGIDSHSLWS